ncbi:hypothetical protein SRB5_12600 [Streptomyces sp. RB5]|uniref:ARG and Rhodanese-Phosphatase-superfamily-associated domain-containing protein n=1 Tax=Streptomyces smaragdinus TaxID=2585196 RepID=A0A7K0CCQ6_9ACTN|nr:hypothetical protein [Streptomyces smaragdinus]MQY11146.1 hypothetical protein [Streptomyces smaragdinus]
MNLDGLTPAPSQVWGAIRLVPLLRAQPLTDLRLHREVYEQTPYGVVRLNDGTAYTSYIPHGLVASFTRDGGPAVAYGTQIVEPDRPVRCCPVRFHRRMVRRGDRGRVRFFPLHLAMEGYLALHFGGPSVIWEEWSQRAVRQGLSPRTEQAYTGGEVEGLRDALRIFEIHPGQCGVLVYAADALAAAFVVPHPDDYRVLHATLLQDMYGELIHHYAVYGGPVPEFTARLDAGGVRSLDDLRAAARAQEREWAAFHDSTMAAGLPDETYTYDRQRRMGRYDLVRFRPPFERQREQHIGEAITGRDGRLAYLKTFRLSENQVRRGHLLTTLAAHDWHIGAAAEAFGCTHEELVRRIGRLGFGELVQQHVRDHAHRRGGA